MNIVLYTKILHSGCLNGRSAAKSAILAYKYFLKNPVDDTDLYGILKETMDGDSHNDIKKGYLKCRSNMAEADIVFPNPSDLVKVVVVSENI